MKTVTIPFDLELAKKIQNGELSGKIVNGEGTEFEVVKWDSKGDYPLIGVYLMKKLVPHEVLHSLMKAST